MPSTTNANTSLDLGRQSIGGSRKRKGAYIARKEEKLALETQIDELERKAARLRVQIVRGPFVPECDPTADRLALDTAAREHQRVVAKLQSLMSDCVRSQQFSHPLDTPIHLGSDWDERLHLLQSMKRAKLVTAYRYILERSRGHHESNPGLSKPHHSEERFEAEDGTFCCNSFELVPFYGVQSVRQVFDAALAFFQSMEISIMEKLGHLTLRDDCYDDSVISSSSGDCCMGIDDKVSHYRLVSGESPGLATEMNLVGFPQFFDNIADILGDNDEKMTECGLFTSDCVDRDDMYPYQPKERIRRDISAAIALTPTEIANSRGEKELIVVMRRAAFLKIHSAQVPVSKAAVDSLRDGINTWGDIMIKAMRGMLYSQSHA